MELKRSGAVPAKGIAERLGLSLNAVRHHVKELEAAGLVGYERENRGVGAPALRSKLHHSDDVVSGSTGFRAYGWSANRPAAQTPSAAGSSIEHRIRATSEGSRTPDSVTSAVISSSGTTSK